ncbi:hypothetical protein [Bradyrhizobium valentinum]|nr:hypothetical protein [Bradyrhizobium valentinum]
MELAARVEVATLTITKTCNWALNNRGRLTNGARAYLPANWPEEA